MYHIYSSSKDHVGDGVLWFGKEISSHRDPQEAERIASMLRRKLPHRNILVFTSNDVHWMEQSKEEEMRIAEKLACIQMICS